MELKKYKKKRITPQGWKEVTLADAFNTSSGATPLSTEASYYENGTIPWINSGELASPYIYGTTNFISQAGFENSSTEIYPIDTVLEQVRHLCLKWKRVQIKLFVRFFQTKTIVLHFLNIVLIRFMIILSVLAVALQEIIFRKQN